MSQVCITYATGDDLEAMAAIESRLFSRPWKVEHFREAFAREYATLLVAKAEQTVCGYVCMYCSADEGEITNVAVDPSFRRMGIGTELMNAAQSEAREKHLQQLILEVRISNEPAISLYNKMGFVNCGVRKNFYAEPVEDAALMVWESKEC